METTTVNKFFWTTRGAERWAAENNPFPAYTREWLLWQLAFWDAQAEAAAVRALVAGSVSFAAGLIVVAAAVVRLVTQ